MMKSGLLRRGKAAALAATILMVGTMWASSCSLREVRDSLWSGVLGALEGASATAVDSLIGTFWTP